jgi:hypothetical protein
MHTGIATRAGWRVRVWRVRERDHQKCPVAVPYPSSRVAGSESAAHAGLSVLYSPSMIYNCIQKICTETLYPLPPFRMDLDLPTSKRKRTINPKLLDDDNMSHDAIKRRKLEASKSVPRTQISTSQPSNNISNSTTQPKSSTSRRASVEAVEDDEVINRRNAGTPKNPNTILESADDDDDIYVTDAKGTPEEKRKEVETEDEPEETDEDELSKLGTAHRVQKLITHL